MLKWAIVGDVRQTFREEVLTGYRKLETEEGASAPVLAAAGHAWLPKDVEKGAKLLKQALAVDREHPANDAGEVEAAFERLQNLALLAGDYEQVADLLRQRALRARRMRRASRQWPCSTCCRPCQVRTAERF